MCTVPHHSTTRVSGGPAGAGDRSRYTGRGGEELDGVDPRRGRRRFHRLELRAARARAHGRAGRRPRSPHLCRQPGEPRGRPIEPALCVRPGRHRGSRGGRGTAAAASARRRREPGRRDPRRPLDRRPARVRRDEPGRHLRAPRRGAPASRVARARAPGPLPVPPRLHRRGVRLPRADGTFRRGEPVRAELAVRRVEGRRRPPRARILRDVPASRRCSRTARTTTGPTSTRRS